ncbi:hypothetical protein ACFC1T_02455 [Kitasatospora sp. NPDC056076]|uniref:hypothetical protein n=1 Tax=Kitasatospora sp. NPDC056076 TaxID=3345703 RepID=UPI0035DCC025
MSDAGGRTQIGSTQGPTHTGSGDQNNYHYHYDSERLIRDGADPLRVAVERRRWLSERFVPPPGYERADAGLRACGTAVLISGADGNGRRTAAVVLLHRAGAPSDPFREVAPDEKLSEAGSLAEGERVLLDLSGASEQQLVDAQTLVQSYWDKVEACRGRLAVVLSSEHEHRLHQDFRQLMVRVGRPAGDQVLARHLRDVPLPARRRPELGKLLDGSPMRDLQRLSELVMEARTAGGDSGVWFAKAIAALRNRGREVARQIADLKDGRQRALLFAAAMLDGASTDAVFRFAEQLLRKVGHPEDERPRFDHVDLKQRLTELRVDVVGGRVHFAALAYAGAVRTHFWQYYPDLRAAFGEWVGDVVGTTAGLETPDRRRLVDRFTEQALSSGDVQVLTGMVESWVAETRLLPEVMRVLEQGLRSETSGSAFRKKTYDWSVTPRLHPSLVQALALICVDVMAPERPDQALVRLHQLARREPDGVPRYARTALLELAGRKEQLYLRLLGRAIEGMERTPPWRADSGIFQALVEALLSAARQEQDGGERLMGILIDAAEGGNVALNRLYLHARAWAAGPDDVPGRLSRAEVAVRFCRRIDEAQGIGPLVGGSRR